MSCAIVPAVDEERGALVVSGKGTAEATQSKLSTGHTCMEHMANDTCPFWPHHGGK